VGELVNGLPDGMEIGLQVYGHRRKGDCNDIEMMVPIGNVDKAAVINKINAIMPMGKTPITHSFELAHERLKTIEDETTVVLISDGKETCGGDPCGLVKSMRQQGIKVRVHVVGFDVGTEERAQLNCIAEAGEGRYFNADNAQQLAQALTEVKREIVAPPPPPPPPPAPEPVAAGTEIIEPGCSFAAAHIEGALGSKHIVFCPAGCESVGSLWGTDVYTSDSKICKAAIHAGLLGTEGGLVGVVLEKGRPAYRGSRRNQLTSSDYGKYGGSFRLFTPAGVTPPRHAPPEPVATAGKEVIEAGCSFAAAHIEGAPGSRHVVSCPSECAMVGSLWGTGYYTSDSKICKAAIHAGLLGPEGGMVGVILEKGRPAYRGSTHNQISSSDYGKYGGSFRLAPVAGGAPAPVAAAAPASPAAPTGEVIEPGCSFTAAQIDGAVGSKHRVSCPEGCASVGTLWGTDVYTADSQICKAAIHAGLLGPEGGMVGVVLVEGRPAYRGSTRNQISSSDYGQYGKSFRLFAPGE
ncbi:MAG: LCCL domain-containing protein, partial [Myxococcota bacterium]